MPGLLNANSSAYFGPVLSLKCKDSNEISPRIPEQWDNASPRCRKCHKQGLFLREVILHKVPMYFSSAPSFLDSSYHVTPESDIITVLRVLRTLQIHVPYWLWQLHQSIHLLTQSCKCTNSALVMRQWEVWIFVTLVTTIWIIMALAAIMEIWKSWEIISTFITCKNIHGGFPFVALLNAKKWIRGSLLTIASEWGKSVRMNTCLQCIYKNVAVLA